MKPMELPVMLYLHPHINSSLLGPNTLFRALSSNTKDYVFTIAWKTSFHVIMAALLHTLCRKHCGWISHDVSRDYSSQVHRINVNSHELFRIITSVNNFSLPYDKET
jgi:hypothetical protein